MPSASSTAQGVWLTTRHEVPCLLGQRPRANGGASALTLRAPPRSTSHGQFWVGRTRNRRAAMLRPPLPTQETARATPTNRRPPLPLQGRGAVTDTAEGGRLDGGPALVLRRVCRRRRPQASECAETEHPAGDRFRVSDRRVAHHCYGDRAQLRVRPLLATDEQAPTCSASCARSPKGSREPGQQNDQSDRKRVAARRSSASARPSPSRRPPLDPNVISHQCGPADRSPRRSPTWSSGAAKHSASSASGNQAMASNSAAGMISARAKGSASSWS